MWPQAVFHFSTPQLVGYIFESAAMNAGDWLEGVVSKVAKRNLHWKKKTKWKTAPKSEKSA